MNAPKQAPAAAPTPTPTLDYRQLLYYAQRGIREHLGDLGALRRATGAPDAAPMVLELARQLIEEAQASDVPLEISLLRMMERTERDLAGLAAERGEGAST